MEDPNELSDNLKQLLEKYESIAMNLCTGGSAMYFAALGNLLKVGHIDKDLELQGIQTVTTATNFLRCVEQAIGGSGTACVSTNNWLCKNDAYDLTQVIEDYSKNKDIEALKQKSREYNRKVDVTKRYLKKHNEAQLVVAEIYARYITTRGTSKSQVIEVLAAVRQEQKHVAATWLYICSLFTIITAQLNQVCTNNSDDIPVELLAKLYIHAAFINELVHTVDALGVFNLCTTLMDLLTEQHTTFEDMYLYYQSKCSDAEEKIKEIIAERKKELQVQMRDWGKNI